MSNSLSTLNAKKVTVIRAFRNKAVEKVQKRQFLLFWVAPNLLVLLLFPVVGFPTFAEMTLLFVGWLVTILGVSVGYHRYFSHKSFKTSPTFEGVLAIAGMMSGGGTLVSWVATHRRHHEKTDTCEDPHTPHCNLNQSVNDLSILRKLKGYFYAWMGWVWNHEYPDPMFYAKDIYKKPSLLLINRMYYLWVVAGLFIPAFINFLIEPTFSGFLGGFFYGGLLRMVLVNHLVSSVNSLCHGFGTRRYSTNDESTNVWWLAIPTIGECWHNNHHADQLSALMGHSWWELDAGGYFLLVLERFGIVWDVRRPRVKSP
jgi:stearoyl-CoA desaturase (Delta-9 desaturase)